MKVIYNVKHHTMDLEYLNSLYGKFTKFAWISDFTSKGPYNLLIFN